MLLPVARFRLNPWLMGGALALVFAVGSLLVRARSSESLPSVPRGPDAAPQTDAKRGGSGPAKNGAPVGSLLSNTPCPVGTLPDTGTCIPEPQSPAAQ